MTPELEQTIEQYETLKIRIAELEREADALKPALLEALPIKTKIVSEFGTITVEQKSTWKFSDELEEMKKREKADGTAVEKLSAPYVKFVKAK